MDVNAAVVEGVRHTEPLAQRQDAKSLEPRATVSLARLPRCPCRSDAARESIAATRGWFTEGFDMKDAKALSDESKKGAV